MHKRPSPHAPWCGVPKALLQEGNGRDVYPRVQVHGRAVCISARSVLVCYRTAGPVHNRTWPALLCRRVYTVTEGLVGPLHRVRRAAPSVFCVRCRTAWCCAPHCTVCALSHCTCGQWAVGSATPATHCHTAWRLWAVQLLLCTASLLVGSGQWSSCYAPPDCLGAVGSGTAAMQRHTAWGQWAVDFCNAPAHKLPFGNRRHTSPHRHTTTPQHHTPRHHTYTLLHTAYHIHHTTHATPRYTSHATPHHVTSHHITSHHITLHHVMSCHTTSNHITTHSIISRPSQRPAPNTCPC